MAPVRDMGKGTATEPTTRRRRIIERPRLTRLLDASQGRIKMLVAPAGYGKTTLARQWLKDKQAVWYTATAASVDVAALAAGLQSSVSEIVEGAGNALVERLPITSRPHDEARILAGMLSADLASWPSGAWVVIDDYHEIVGAQPAEDFVESLLIDAPLNVLLLTRDRPRWASSRRILYGELFEVDRSLLAMSDAEAVALLGKARPSTNELVTLAKGWPAVLALAAVLEASPPRLIDAPHLYGFFADEIYRRLDRRMRRRLAELALFDVDGRHIALRQVQADEAERVVATGLACGFLSERGDGRLDIHPLVRTFLLLKLREERPRALAGIVDRAVRTLLAHRLWDEAFAIIGQFDRDDLVPLLLASSLEELLATGRTATLATWLRDSRATAPVVRLATAEVAFREGRFYESEALAALAADDLAADPDLSARASLVAGRAAHVASRETQARSYYKKAHTLATEPRFARRAASGELLAMIELEDPLAEAALNALSDGQPLEPSEQVLLADRRLAYATRFGTPLDLQGARAASQLLRFVTDPVARSSFRNIFGYSLAVTAHFDEASHLTDEQLKEAERYRLEFVVPYALTVHALVASGRRAYGESADLLDEADERALETGNVSALQTSTAIRMRMLIAQASFEEALAKSDVDLTTATRSLHGELLGVTSLALAGLGQSRRSAQVAESALRASVGVEAGITANCALAVCALNQDQQEVALSHAKTALERTVHTGMVDSFVCAYRGCPQLLVCLLQEREQHAPLELVLTRAGDRQLVPDSGRGQAEHSVRSLSPREKEVLALLAQGLTNAQIGRVLFISPVTVKVHVRHIYEKLGVRSRAAAALRATQLSRD